MEVNPQIIEAVKNISTDDLALVLAQRPDIRKSDGLVRPAVWQCRAAMGAIPCVDGIVVRKSPIGSYVEGGLIRRATGKFAGKLCLIGGAVAHGESIEHAMRRHFLTDLGVKIGFLTSWRTPIMNQYYPVGPDGNPPTDFSEDPGKHSYASTHLVLLATPTGEIQFGASDYGVEASGFEWVSLDNFPDEDRFAYRMGPIIRMCLRVAGEIYSRRNLLE